MQRNLWSDLESACRFPDTNVKRTIFGKLVGSLSILFGKMAALVDTCWLIGVLGDNEPHPKVERWFVYRSLFLQSLWGANGRRPVVTSRSGVNLLAVGRD